jgi:hypothetical protein
MGRALFSAKGMEAAALAIWRAIDQPFRGFRTLAMESTGSSQASAAAIVP